jgi:hypothetical protein
MGMNSATKLSPRLIGVWNILVVLKQMRVDKTSPDADSLCEIATRVTLPASKLRTLPHGIDHDYESDQGATVSSGRNDAATVGDPDRRDSTDGECH